MEEDRNMKKTYTAPDVNIIEYKVEDVLLASGVGMLGLLNKEEENQVSVTTSGWLSESSSKSGGWLE